MKTVRLGMIGCGPRARGLLKTCRAVRDLELVAVCDKIPALADEAAAVSGIPDIRIYTDHAKMLKEAPVDAVFIIVEPENCARLAVESLEAGRHVLSEVPMAFTMEDCWSLITAVEKTGLIYQLGEQMRYRYHIEKWKALREAGELGSILCAEGEYLHGMGDDRYYLDPETGRRLTLQEAAAHPCPRKSRFWEMPHPILYLPHELSPLLRVLDDRVVSLHCIGTRPPSRVHEFFPNPDFEVALMRTEKDAILRLSCCFTAPGILRSVMGYHWQRIIGTKGCVETHRADPDKMKWMHDPQSGKPEEVWWDNDPETPQEILESGHGGSDMFPIRDFVKAILTGTPPELDVYRAAETAAPAILAAQSAEKDGLQITVPDFRPGARRKWGSAP